MVHAHTCLIFLAARKYRVRVPVCGRRLITKTVRVSFFFSTPEIREPRCARPLPPSTHTRVRVPSYRPYIFVSHGCMVNRPRVCAVLKTENTPLVHAHTTRQYYLVCTARPRWHKQETVFFTHDTKLYFSRTRVASFYTHTHTRTGVAIYAHTWRDSCKTVLV